MHEKWFVLWMTVICIEECENYLGTVCGGLHLLFSHFSPLGMEMN